MGIDGRGERAWGRGIEGGGVARWGGRGMGKGQHSSAGGVALVRARWLLRLAVGLALVGLVSCDFYRTLGVRRTADVEVIKRAHRDLVKKLHPDKSKSADTTRRFQDVQRAYEVLSDPDKRKLYDQYGKDPDDPDVVQQQQQQEAMKRHHMHQHRHPMDDFFHRSRKQQFFVPSKTQTLTMDNYDSLVVNGGQIWVIQVWREFNCEKCIQVSDAWEEAAKRMTGVVNFGRVNFDRQSSLLNRYRIRQLPTFIAITNKKRDVKFFDYNRQVTTDTLVDFASKVVPDGSLVYLKSAAAADKFLKSDPEKVHVILFIEEWAAFTSVSSIPSFRDDMVFAFAARWAPHGLDALYGTFKERTVVAVKDGGKFVAKSGIQSRKSLVKWLLKNRHLRVPRVSASNYAQLCLGWGGAAEGLHFVPQDRNTSTVCVLSLRKDSKPQARPEVEAMLQMRDDYWQSKAQFGWLDANEQPRLWNYLVSKAGLSPDIPFVLAAVDWEHGVTTVFEDTGPSHKFKASVHNWLEGIAKSDEWLDEKDAGTVPGLQLRSSRFEKVGASAEGAVASLGGTLSSMGLTRVLMLFGALMAMFRVMSNLISGGGGHTQNNRQQRQQHSQQQQQQQRERQERQQQEQQQNRQQEEYRQQQQQQQQQQRHREEEKARREAHQGTNGAARGGANHGARQRPAAAKQKMFNDLAGLGVRQLREFAESHRINISDCSEKSEIVDRIMANLRE